MRIKWIFDGTIDTVQTNTEIIQVWNLVKEIGYCASEFVCGKADNMQSGAYSW